LKVNPTNATFYYLKGCCLKSLNNYTEAIECLDIAIDIEPDDEDYREEMGNVLDLKKKSFF
jgi:tetratricopeptide (TPR) repeat protein